MRRSPVNRRFKTLQHILVVFNVVDVQLVPMQFLVFRDQIGEVRRRVIA